MDNEKFITIGLGEVLWDMLPDGKLLGGAPANVAFHTQNLGGKGIVVSSVGDDNSGKEILDKLNGLELETGFIHIDPDHTTGTVTVKLDQSGIPEYIIHKDVAWDHIPFTPDIKDLAQKADAVCFGTLAQRSETSRNTIINFLKSTKKECLRLCDINLRQSFYSQEIIEQSLQLSNMVKLNDDELITIADILSLNGKEDEILRSMIKKYDLNLIALTKGKDGSRILTEKEDSHFKEKVDKIADTIGAGDSFSATLLNGLLNEKPLKEIHRHAVQVAGYVCTQNGATPLLPDDLK